MYLRQIWKSVDYISSFTTHKNTEQFQRDSGEKLRVNILPMAEREAE
jgi:uncharacterized protein with HEPN domain